MSEWSDQRLARLIAVRQMIDRLEEVNRQNSIELVELRQRYKLLEADFMKSEIDKFEKMWQTLESKNNEEPEAPNEG